MKSGHLVCRHPATEFVVAHVALAMPVERKSAAPAREATPAPDDLVRPHPGGRPGGIDIDLASGVRLSVDSYVNEKALARVLRALREAS